MMSYQCTTVDQGTPADPGTGSYHRLGPYDDSVFQLDTFSDRGTGMHDDGSGTHTELGQEFGTIPSYSDQHRDVIGEAIEADNGTPVYPLSHPVGTNGLDEPVYQDTRGLAPVDHFSRKGAGP